PRGADTGHSAAGAPPAAPGRPRPRRGRAPESGGRGRAAARREAGTPAVVAMAIAAQQHGLVALDRDGHVIRPAKLWNDTESAPDAEWLVDQLGGPEPWVKACGSVPVASFTISKLSWRHRTEPGTFGPLARGLLPPDWPPYR